MFKKMLWIVGSAIGGIYLTSKEGENARKTILKKKTTFEPIVKDLLNQAKEALEGSREIQSDELKANIDKIISEAKTILIDLDLEKTTETIQEAIRVASKKIRIAMSETEKESYNLKKPKSKPKIKKIKK